VYVRVHCYLYCRTLGSINAVHVIFAWRTYDSDVPEIGSRKRISPILILPKAFMLSYVACSHTIALTSTDASRAAFQGPEALESYMIGRGPRTDVLAARRSAETRAGK